MPCVVSGMSGYENESFLVSWFRLHLLGDVDLSGVFRTIEVVCEILRLNVVMENRIEG